MEMNKAHKTAFCLHSKQDAVALHLPEGIPADLAVCGIPSFLFNFDFSLPDYGDALIIIFPPPFYLFEGTAVD